MVLLNAGIREAFAMSLQFGTVFDRPLSREACDRFIENMARTVVEKRMETMTIFMLDAHRPFSFMASQALLLTAPVLGAFFGFNRINRWSRILEDRENLERLLQRIEALAGLRDAACPGAEGDTRV